MMHGSACVALQGFIVVELLDQHLFPGRTETVAVIKAAGLEGLHGDVARSLVQARKADHKVPLPVSSTRCEEPLAVCVSTAVDHAVCRCDSSFASDKTNDERKRLKKVALRLLARLSDSDKPDAFRSTLLDKDADVTADHLRWLSEDPNQGLIWGASALEATSIIADILVDPTPPLLTEAKAVAWRTTLEDPNRRVRFVLARVVAALRILATALKNAANDVARDEIKGKMFRTS
jgi:hypothetical protein